MISLKSSEEIAKLREAGKIVYQTHQYVKQFIKPGVTLLELNKKCENYIVKTCKSYPSFKGLYGFPAAVCISVNDVVVHGIPDNYKLKEGDIVSIDIGASFKGYHGDSAWTYPVGKISKEDEYLLKHTEESLYEGIKKAVPGNRVGDISAAVEAHAKKYDLGVVKELCGHGVGTKVHEEPDVPNYGTAGRGPLLREGMVIAIEPMLNMGGADIYEEDDGWTIRTLDGSKSAHFEHTVAITKDGPKILTGEWKFG